MKPFRWGKFADFVEAARVVSDDIELWHGATGEEFGRIDLCEQDGEGMVEYYCGPTLRVLVFDCAFREGRTFHVVDDGWIRFNFSLNISVDMAFGGRPSVHALTPSWRFVSVPRDDLTIEIVPPNARLQWVTVCCQPEMLGELAHALPDDLPLRAAAPTGDGFVYHPYQFTPLLRGTTMDVFDQRPKGGLRASYVAAKAQELLILGLDYMLNQQSVEFLSQQVRLTERDITALHAARAILDEDVAHPPTVQALGLRVGLNRNKLFYGFRSLFGQNISEYLQSRRIEEGYRLLTATDVPISEIAAQIGFRHQCNFSTAFKASFGVAPSAIRARESTPHTLPEVKPAGQSLQ